MVLQIQKDQGTKVNLFQVCEEIKGQERRRTGKLANISFKKWKHLIFIISVLQFELLVLFDYEDPQWGLTEDDVAELKEIFTLFDTDNVGTEKRINEQWKQTMWKQNNQIMK